MAKDSKPLKNNPATKDELDDLKDFIRRKKVQNKALKKIIDKINNPDKNKSK